VTNSGKTAPLGTVTSMELHRRTGATYRQVDYWMRKGFIVPVKPAEGSGVALFYPESEVRVARAIRDYMKLGCEKYVQELSVAVRNAERGTQRVAVAIDGTVSYSFPTTSCVVIALDSE
jgi:MerR HTH family regulatory protein